MIVIVSNTYGRIVSEHIKTLRVEINSILCSV